MERRQEETRHHFSTPGGRPERRREIKEGRQNRLGPNDEPDLAGYIFYERVNDIYVALGDVEPSPEPTFTIPRVARGIHYFAVTAYDTDGEESDPSEELVYNRTLAPQ